MIPTQPNDEQYDRTTRRRMPGLFELASPAPVQLAGAPRPAPDKPADGHTIRTVQQPRGQMLPFVPESPRPQGAQAMAQSPLAGMIGQVSGAMDDEMDSRRRIAQAQGQYAQRELDRQHEQSMMSMRMQHENQARTQKYDLLRELMTGRRRLGPRR